MKFNAQKNIGFWCRQGALPVESVSAALRLAGIPPSRCEWREFIDRLLLWLGTAALLTGLIFFVAANWSAMGRFAKFALAEAAIVAALAAYMWRGTSRYGNAALLAASLAVGALLALVGQTYQTGANTFELFLTWALMIFPWVVIARLPALWVLWLAILHAALWFYAKVFDDLWGLSIREENVLLWIVALDAVALALWEGCAARGQAWMRGRWVPRLIALTGCVVATTLVVIEIFSYGDNGAPYFIGYAVLLAGLYGRYRKYAPDLFMLATGTLSLVVVSISALMRGLTHQWGRLDAGSLLILGLFSMLATAGTAWWLRRVAREQTGARLP